MSFNFFISQLRLILHSNNEPLIIFTIVAIAGVVFGKIFYKFKLPDITGQVIIGIVIGLLYGHHELESIVFIQDIALAVMCFSIGTHLNYKILHNSSNRIFALAIFDSIFAFSIVFSVLYFVIQKFDLILCLMMASIAVATAPGTIISLIQKKYTRGMFTKTLLGVVALNNFFTVIIFELSKTISYIIKGSESYNIGKNISSSVYNIFLTLLLGAIIGKFISIITKRQHENGELFATVFLSIIVTVILCKKLELSYLLCLMTSGIIFSNSSYQAKKISDIFKNINELLFAVFFTLAGTHLDFQKLTIAGITGIIFVISRIFAKSAAAFFASRLFKYPKVIKNFLGMGMIPQGALAIGLVISLNEVTFFSNSIGTISTVILASVTINELLGPFIASKSFDFAKETGQLAPRLIDFLHEEYILLPLEANNKWHAIEKMTDFLVKTNHLYSITRDDLLNNTYQRERKCSTGIGSGLAIPHARIPKKEKLMGVIGICKDPLDYESIDGKPVNIIILIATPVGKENLYLKILAAISKIFLDDPLIYNKIINASSPAEIYDLFQSKQIRDINFFLD